MNTRRLVLLFFALHTLFAAVAAKEDATVSASTKVQQGVIRAQQSLSNGKTDEAISILTALHRTIGISDRERTIVNIAVAAAAKQKRDVKLEETNLSAVVEYGSATAEEIVEALPRLIRLAEDSGDQHRADYWRKVLARHQILQLEKGKLEVSRASSQAAQTSPAPHAEFTLGKALGLICTALLSAWWSSSAFRGWLRNRSDPRRGIDDAVYLLFTLVFVVNFGIWWAIDFNLISDRYIWMTILSLFVNVIMFVSLPSYYNWRKQELPMSAAAKWAIIIVIVLTVYVLSELFSGTTCVECSCTYSVTPPTSCNAIGCRCIRRE